LAKKFTELATNSTPKYFYLLDIVRGFAALAVVLWHWPHFYTVKDEAFIPGFHVSNQPLYAIFYVFYNYGLIAVDLFFLISGFVFFYLYSNSVADKIVSATSFTALRFSRLYPLHFITLFIVLLLQVIFYRNTGYYFVYPYNNVYHFTLNIFFASSWGLEKGPSFNGPNWSVSVEILLYVLFFIICRNNIKKIVLPLLLFCGLVIQFFYPPIGHGLYSFFLGGILYYTYLRIVQLNKQASYLKVLRIVSVCYVVFILLESKFSFVESAVLAGLRYLPVHVNWALLIAPVNNLLVRTFIFPVFLLYAVLLETVKGPRGKSLSFVGHISYSSYLLHFPLQLIFMLCCSPFITDRVAFFNSNITFLIFFAILITISLLSYHYFELPAQKLLRSKLISKKAVG